MIKRPYTSLFKVGDIITSKYWKPSKYYYVLGAPCSPDGAYVLLNPYGEVVEENHILGTHVEMTYDLVSSVFRETDD
jgi:hypothetical protein